MSQHEQVVAEMRRFIDDRADCTILSPTVLAVAAYDRFATTAIEPHLHWASIEHFKTIARSVLRSTFKDNVDEHPSLGEQEEMFSDLQYRYALPVKSGEEPQYKRRSDLTLSERRKIADRFRRCGRSWIIHADKLVAEGEALAQATAAA